MTGRQETGRETGDREMVDRETGISETGRQGDKKTGRQEDMETWRHGYRETGIQGDTDRLADREAGDLETVWRETRRRVKGQQRGTPNLLNVGNFLNFCRVTRQ